MSSAETIVLLNRTAENSEHFDKLWEGRIHLQFACVVNWSDVFGDPQVAEFKFGVTSDEDEKFFGPIPPYKKLMKGFQADAQTPAERGKKGHG